MAYSYTFNLELCTTDGSPLYSLPIEHVFGNVPHQVCEFSAKRCRGRHVIKELTKAILHAVAKVRKQLKNTVPNLGRGRPTKAQRRIAQQRKRIGKKIADLFEHRYLFVKHHLTTGERKILQRITRGLPQLRTLRDVIDQVYRLFDRRCRTETALGKLAKLHQRVRHFKRVGKTLSKLFSPNLEKELTFLDDSLLPPTSNAVERGFRRHRKVQKSVCRVRTQDHIVIDRIALDMHHDAQAETRSQPTHQLHLARNNHYP